MLAVVHGVEGLAVAAAAPVVDREDGVAMVDQVLGEAAVAQPRLAAGAAVDQHQAGDLGRGRGSPGAVEDAGDLGAVEGLEARHLRRHKVLGIDRRVEGMGELAQHLAGLEIADVEVARAGRLGVEGHQ